MSYSVLQGFKDFSFGHSEMEQFLRVPTKLI